MHRQDGCEPVRASSRHRRWRRLRTCAQLVKMRTHPATTGIRWPSVKSKPRRNSQVIQESCVWARSKRHVHPHSAMTYGLRPKSWRCSGEARAPDLTVTQIDANEQRQESNLKTVLHSEILKPGKAVDCSSKYLIPHPRPAD